jgi:hypothetical protein
LSVLYTSFFQRFVKPSGRRAFALRAHLTHDRILKVFQFSALSQWNSEVDSKEKEGGTLAAVGSKNNEGTNEKAEEAEEIQAEGKKEEGGEDQVFGPQEGSKKSSNATQSAKKSEAEPGGNRMKSDLEHFTASPTTVASSLRKKLAASSAVAAAAAASSCGGGGFRQRGNGDGNNGRTRPSFSHSTDPRRSISSGGSGVGSGGGVGSRTAVTGGAGSAATAGGTGATCTRTDGKTGGGRSAGGGGGDVDDGEVGWCRIHCQVSSRRGGKCSVELGDKLKHSSSSSTIENSDKTKQASLPDTVDVLWNWFQVTGVVLCTACLLGKHDILSNVRTHIKMRVVLYF